MNHAAWWLPESQQQAFRAVLDGFARPGTLVLAPPHGAVLMFLSVVLDESVSLADPGHVLTAETRHQLLAPSAPVEQARFVLLEGSGPPDPDFRPSLGTLESPELGATLVLSVQALTEVAATTGSLTLRLTGPGVPGTRTLAVHGLHGDWLARRDEWVASFPKGVDLVLAAPDRLVALPRTTRITVGEKEGGN